MTGQRRAADDTSYSSFATFTDPDGNSWLLQEVTTRLPGRIDSADTSYTSVNDLMRALIRASTAHGEHEQRTGVRDEEWPAWYAAYMVAEQYGTCRLPKRRPPPTTHHHQTPIGN